MPIKIEHPGVNPRQERLLELTATDMEHQEAITEYVAMMADVELPEDDEEEAGDE